ncbi:transposase [Candidatus Obscuribacterales bacterium]|nr:transposase [Candidatus Obscuribacterales bacterium]MBX3138641.1 transposase [Candidatus Obscuribacterales bacterium]
MIFVGIDVSKETLDCHRQDRKNSKLHVSNSPAGFKRITKWIQPHADDVHFCMEATGKLWEPLAEFLHQLGYRVSVVNPALIHAFGKSQFRRSKTDAIDAEIIADFCSKMEPPTWTPMDPDTRSLRDICREIAALKKNKTQITNRMKSGRLDERASSSQKRQLEFITDEIQVLEKLAKELVSENPTLKSNANLLQTIKGVGWRTAFTFLSELSMVDSFKSLRQVEAFCGLNPTIRESGSSVRGRPKISKMGNSAIRNALYMAALTATRFNLPVAEFASRLAAKGKKGKVILCAASRKLLRIMVAVYWSKQPFNPSFKSSGA